MGAKERQFINTKNILLAVGGIAIIGYSAEIIKHWPYKNHKKIPSHNFMSKLGDIFWTPFIRPVMEHFADGKRTNANDWIDNHSFYPDFADFKGLELSGNPNQIERHGMINTVRISLGAWEQKVVLEPVDYEGEWLYAFQDCDENGNPRMKICRWALKGANGFLKGTGSHRVYAMTPDKKKEVILKKIEEKSRHAKGEGELL